MAVKHMIRERERYCLNGRNTCSTVSNKWNKQTTLQRIKAGFYAKSFQFFTHMNRHKSNNPLEVAIGKDY